MMDGRRKVTCHNLRVAESPNPAYRDIVPVSPAPSPLIRLSGNGRDGRSIIGDH